MMALILGTAIASFYTKHLKCKGGLGFFTRLSAFPVTHLRVENSLLSLIQTSKQLHFSHEYVSKILMKPVLIAV